MRSVPSARLSEAIRSGAKRLLAVPANTYLRAIPRDVPIDSFERIYCHHIRKTGGTSLTRAFLSLEGEDHQEVYERLWRGMNYFTTSGDLTFVAHNPHLIEAGHYFYGFSHRPAHQISLPARTFEITILRDPVSRVISHYRMLVHLSSTGSDHPCLEAEGPWLGESFGDFLSAIPREHLLRQLYMFSSEFDVSEASRRIDACDHVFRTEDYQTGISELSEKLALEIPTLHAKKSTIEVSISSGERERLRELVEPEYELLDRVASADLRSA